MPPSNAAPAIIWQPVFFSPDGDIFLDDRAPLIWFADLAKCCKSESYSANAIGTRVKWFECRSCKAAYATVAGPS